MNRRRYRFGEFEFDPASGELTPLDRRAAATQAPARLPPQPSRLLELLVEARGDVVSRETIRETIWPGVRVEFDSGLHFCIRQIRAALGDSASDPSYIGTLPRRGYRLLTDVEEFETTEDPAMLQELVTEPPASGATRPGSQRRLVAVLLLLLFGAGAAFVIFRMFEAPVDAAPVERAATPAAVSVGVMPFRPPAPWISEQAADVAELSTVADGVLEALASSAGGRLRVVGPSNTASFDGQDQGLHDLVLAYDLDYIVNGRFVLDDEGPRLLAELIRSADGAHVWVKRYESFDDGDEIAAEISRAVLERLVPTIP